MSSMQGTMHEAVYETMQGTYSYPLVFLSLAISVFCSYCALDLYERVITLQGRAKTVWTILGSTAMGLGIWSMHFIGMLAFYLPIQVHYNIVLVIVSMIGPIGASWMALAIITGETLTRFRLGAGGMFVTVSIGGMHYIGMEAMQLPGTIEYSPLWIGFSVLITFIISLSGLRLAFFYRFGANKKYSLPKGWTVFIFGMAIAGFHYIGMLAVEFKSNNQIHLPSHEASDLDQTLVAVWIGAVAIIIMLLLAVSHYLDRKSVLRQAEWNQLRYDSIFEHNPDMVCLFDLNGLLIRTNPAAERITGYDPAAFLNVPFTKMVSRKDSLKIRASFNKALEGKPQTVEFTVRHKEGYPIHLVSTIVPLEAGGSIVDIYTISKDVTEQKKAQQELQRAKADAEKGARIKSEFLAIMSHEIRTPLNGVIGMSGILLETELTDEQKEYVKIIVKSGKALLNVINDVLDFSKMESGKMTLQSEPFSIRECLEETLHLFDAQIQKRKLNIRHYVAEELPPVLIGDEGRFRQVLINLIGNAVKFTEHGGVDIELRTLERAGEALVVQCKVRDTGIGIAPANIPHLFQPFYQLDSSVARKHSGSGLGLAICKKLVELMGGNIGVESKEGEGATFTFTIQVSRCH